MQPAPIVMSKGPRGAARWRKGGGPWKYGKPPVNFEPAPKDLQYRYGLTRADLPVYKKHAPLDLKDSLRGVRAWGDHGWQGVHGATQESRHTKGRDAAEYYSHHGDEVVNNYLRHGTKQQEARLALAHDKELARLMEVEEHFRGEYVKTRDELTFGGLVESTDPRLDEARQATRAARLAREAHEARGSQQVDVSDLAKHTVRELDAYIAGQRLKTDVNMFRGGSFSSDFIQRLKPGAVFSDKAFVSSTLDRTRALKFANGRGTAETVPTLIHIRGRNGQRAAYMEGLTKHPNEHEMLLPRNTRFRVVSVTPRRGADPMSIVVEVEP